MAVVISFKFEKLPNNPAVITSVQCNGEGQLPEYATALYLFRSVPGFREEICKGLPEEAIQALDDFDFKDSDVINLGERKCLH